MIETDLLFNQVEFLEDYADIRYRYLSSVYRPNALYDNVVRDLIKHANVISMPMCVVATYNQMPAGLCCIRKDDGLNSFTPNNIYHYGWFASFAIDEQFRKIKDDNNKKISEHIVNRIFYEAKESLNLDVLYLHTFEKKLINYYSNFGFEYIDEFLYDERKTTNVMIKYL